MTTPAVTFKSSPVTAAEPPEARNAQAAATSAASTIRPSGDASVSAARACSSLIPRMAACLRTTSSIRGPATGPGHTAFTGASPLGRLVDAGEVAAACAFLAGDDSAAITGEDLNVAAGVVMY